MPNDSQLPELLELVKTVGTRNYTLHDLTAELGYSIDVTKRLFETALKENLIEQFGNTFRLTDKGHAEIRRHREHYIHSRHAHRPDLIGRAARFFEGRIGDWREHWRHGHGFDENSLESFYGGITSLQGRIEDVMCLADLRQGEKAVVAFTLGGRGLLTRLADMGLTRGTEIMVVRSAPLNGPIEILVRGVSLAIGRGVASKIFLQKQGRQPLGN